MGTITQKYNVYDFSGLAFDQGLEALWGEDGFALRCQLKRWPEPGKVLAEVPGTLRIWVREVTEGDESDWDRRENIRSFTAADGSCLVLECEIRVRQLVYPDYPPRRRQDPSGRAWEYVTIGLPFWLLKGDIASHDIVLLYTGRTFELVLDGETVNADYPIGVLRPPQGEAMICHKLLSVFGVSTELKKIRRQERETVYEGGLQFYTPRGFNTWAGDVVLFFHDGVYHVLYFLDRHHHGNRWGGGAHYFQQLTSTDLVNWVDHGPLFELEEPWQSVGTGTMFFHDGRYYFVHGWHTNRTVPVENTATPLMQAYAEAHGGVMHPMGYDELGGKVPSGAAYAVSDDGIHFTMGRKVIHTAENPSVYANERGGLTMYCGGDTWEARDILADWHKVSEGFPPCGEHEPMRQTLECPSFFSWNGYRYLIMGGTGFWTARGDGEYVNSAAWGYDIYDGLDVPMAAEFTGNRRLLAGWLSGIGWGSCIIHRELVQYADGRLGMKWVSELHPQRETALPVPADTVLEEGTVLPLPIQAGVSVVYEMTLTAPRGGRFAVRFRDAAEPSRDCEFQLDFGKERMQMGTITRDGAFCRPLLTLRESLLAKPGRGHGMTIDTVDGYHARSGNFVLEHVDVAKGTFLFRFAVRQHAKMRCTVLDFEVAEQRTLVSNRPRLAVGAVELVSDCGVAVKGITAHTFR